MNLRCYQQRAVNAVNAKFDAGDQRTLVIIPTGGGKTVCAAHVAKRQLERGRVMVLAHRDELIRQAADKFARVTGYLPAIEKADERSDEQNMHGAPPVVVSSIQTQISGRGDRKRMHRFNPFDFAFVWVDEAHHAVARSYETVINHYAQNPNCKILGVTATGDRADGETLGKIFQSIAFDYELPDIIEEGYLVPIRQHCVVIEGLDFSKVRTTAGDLNAGDLEAAMMFEKPLHGVAHATIELACGIPEGSLAKIRDEDDRVDRAAALIGTAKRRKTLVFAAGVKHAERMAEIFNRWIPDSAAHVDGTMSTDLRRSILKRFARGEIQFLTNCMIATEGFDEPGVEVVVIARPTKSRPLYCQMVGRGTRPAADIAHELGTQDDAIGRRLMIAGSRKQHLTVLDFAGNAGRHRLVTVVDILGDRYDDAVIEEAKRACAADGGADVTEALKTAKEDLEQKRRQAEEEQKKREALAEARRQAEAARRARVVGTAGYSTHEVDGMDRYGVRIDRGDVTGNTGIRHPATRKQIDFCIALGIERDKAEKFSRGQAGAVIDRQLKNKVRPDWSLCRSRPAPAPRPATIPVTQIDFSTMPPSSWQVAQLNKLGYVGMTPPTHAAAKDLINTMSRYRRTGS